MNVNLQPASQKYQCAGCKQAFSEDQIETYAGPKGQVVNLCAKCEEKSGGCYLCQEKVVEVNDQTLPGSFDILTSETTIASLCQACAQKTTCIACETPLVKDEMTGLPRPRTLLKGEAFLCGSCRASTETCHECDDVIVLLKRVPYKDAIEVSQANGVSIWLCAQCGANKKFTAQCICGTPLFTDGQKVVSYEPEKLNNRIYICNVCETGKRILCDGCQKNVVAIQLAKGTSLIEKSETYGYTELTMCLECWKGSKTCLCFTPAATSQGNILIGAKVYIEEFSSNDYRCKFCNTLPIVNDASMEEFRFKEALYAKVFSWFTTPVSGLGLSVSPQPSCIMANVNDLIKKDANEAAGMVNGYYSPKTKDIFIARAVTPVRFIAACAHELAHCWQDQQELFDKQSTKICEGFAQWVSYTCLQTMALNFTDERDKREAPRRLDRLKTNRVPAYREGLKYFLEIEATQGRDAVILEAQKGEEN